MATHLADTSALARIHNPEVQAVLGPMTLAGQIATCAVIDLEYLKTARNLAEHAELWLDRTFYPRVACSDAVLERSIEVQGMLAARGRHRAVPSIDLVIAASAELAGLTLLHYDHDFDLIGEVTGQPTEWVVPRGSVP